MASIRLNAEGRKGRQHNYSSWHHGGNDSQREYPVLSPLFQDGKLSTPVYSMGSWPVSPCPRVGFPCSQSREAISVEGKGKEESHPQMLPLVSGKTPFRNGLCRGTGLAQWVKHATLDL